MPKGDRKNTEPGRPEGALLEGLNEAQLKAVTTPDGPFLIVAGAGTGKTMAITKRIAWLILSGRAKPEEILALTFTDKAAEEMGERVDTLLPMGYLDLQISTFHSFCERLLKERGLDIGLPNDFRLMNETDAYLLVRQNFDRFKLGYYRPRSNPTKFIHAMLKHFSRAKDEAVSPGEYLKFAQDLTLDKDLAPEQVDEASRYGELADAYHEYQRLLLENDALDFGDLQTYALELLKKRPAVAASLRKRYRYVLVDEFQDTNWAQYALIKLLVPPDGNLTVVGDDDQSIYKFRGASVSNILQFKNDYPTAREVVLTRNYRSRQEILDLAYAFIRQNDPNRLEAKLAGPDGQGISKKLVAERGDGATIEPMHFNSVEEEADGVVAKIKELKDADPELTWSDFCVLVRSNSGAEEFSLALERAQVPFQFLALRGLYAKPIIMDVLAFFRLLDDYREGPAMYRTLNSRPYRIDGRDLNTLVHEARRRTQSLYEVCRRHAAIADLKQETRDSIERLLAHIGKHTDIARTKGVEEVLISYLFDSGWLKILTAEETGQTRRDLSYLNQFRKRIRRFERLGDDRSLKHFLEEYELEREAGEQGGLEFDPETGPEMVRIMTVHAAKGLEFPYVFVVSLVDKRFPTVERESGIELPEALTKEIIPEGDIHLEEERRLFYVAATRAKDGLYLTWADDYGGKTRKKPSRFLIELGFVQPEEAAGRKRRRVQEDFAEPRELRPAPPPPDVVPAHYSFSQFEAYSRCPLQYRFAHVLRIPTFGNYKSSFGNTMHGTLQKFFEEIARRRGQSQGNLFGKAAAPAAGGRLPVSKDELLKMYEECWIDDWYPDKPTKDDWRRLGQEALSRLYDATAANPPNVLLLEKEFVLKLGDRSVRGKIDRIDELPDGSLEVIDYKTSEPKTEDELKAENKGQLYIYQMAVEQCLGRRASKLSFLYLLDGSRVSFLGSEDDLTKVREKLAEQVAAIESGDFSPKPGPQCAFCDFRGICEYRQDL